MSNRSNVLTFIVRDPGLLVDPNPGLPGWVLARSPAFAHSLFAAGSQQG